jgi:hypothetical protein
MYCYVINHWVITLCLGSEAGTRVSSSQNFYTGPSQSVIHTHICDTLLGDHATRIERQPLY